MALARWDQKLEPLISGGAGNLMLCGPRKSGKSVLCSTLLKQAARLPPKTRPDLVICCCGGSQADYVDIVKQNWDARFLFNRLPPPEFMEALFDQQKVLHESGQQRNVLIVMDDAPVDKDVRNAITEVGYRGRHYNVSIWILAISFVMCPKGLRRSLDALFIMCGLPLASDRKCLTEDFCGCAPEHALWALDNLKTHECLVCTLTKGKFNMYVHKANYISHAEEQNPDGQPVARTCEEGESESEEQGQELQAGPDSGEEHVQGQGHDQGQEEVRGQGRGRMCKEV